MLKSVLNQGSRTLRTHTEGLHSFRCRIHIFCLPAYIQPVDTLTIPIAKNIHATRSVVQDLGSLKGSMCTTTKPVEIHLK